MDSKPKAAAISIASNSLLILLKIVAGVLTGSISLIAEAIHSFNDLVAAIIAFISVRISDRPADDGHPFGHGKAENISGVVEGVLIFVAAVIIIYQGIERLIAGATLEFLEIGIGIMAVSIVVNVLVSRNLLKVSKATDSLALEADARHLTTDVVTMVGVLIGLVIVRVTGLNILDPIIAILVALLIMKTAYDITKKSFGGLMDAGLPKTEEAEIMACFKDHYGQLVGFHDLRTRKAGSLRLVDLHLVMPKNASLSKAHRMCDHLEQDLQNRLKCINITIHVEPCSIECNQCHVSCNLRKVSL